MTITQQQRREKRIKERLSNPPKNKIHPKTQGTKFYYIKKKRKEKKVGSINQSNYKEINEETIKQRKERVKKENETIKKHRTCCLLSRKGNRWFGEKQCFQIHNRLWGTKIKDRCNNTLRKMGYNKPNE